MPRPGQTRRRSAPKSMQGKKNLAGPRTSTRKTKPTTAVAIIPKVAVPRAITKESQGDIMTRVYMVNSHLPSERLKKLIEDELRKAGY